jgi:hypothetical protein
VDTIELDERACNVLYKLSHEVYHLTHAIDSNS